MYRCMCAVGVWTDVELNSRITDRSADINDFLDSVLTNKSASVRVIMDSFSHLLLLIINKCNIVLLYAKQDNNSTIDAFVAADQIR